MTGWSRWKASRPASPAGNIADRRPARRFRRTAGQHRFAEVRTTVAAPPCSWRVRSRTEGHAPELVAQVARSRQRGHAERAPHLCAGATADRAGRRRPRRSGRRRARLMATRPSSVVVCWCKSDCRRHRARIGRAGPGRDGEGSSCRSMTTCRMRRDPSRCSSGEQRGSAAALHDDLQAYGPCPQPLEGSARCCA